MNYKKKIIELEEKIEKLKKQNSIDFYLSWGSPEHALNPIENRTHGNLRAGNYPEIIQNVMHDKDGDWLKLQYVPEIKFNAIPRTHCGAFWINFNDIKITDALARMRTNNQPIWVMGKNYENSKERCQQLFGVDNESECPYITDLSAWMYCRLATVDDLKKAGITK